MKDIDKKFWEAYVNNIVSLHINQTALQRRKTTHISKLLDLHNYTVQEAYVAFNEFINSHSQANNKKVLVVTGKSGQIRQEFPFWLSANNKIKSFEVTNDGGAFSIKLKRK